MVGLLSTVFINSLVCKIKQRYNKLNPNYSWLLETRGRKGAVTGRTNLEEKNMLEFIFLNIKGKYLRNNLCSDGSNFEDLTMKCYQGVE